MPLNNNNSENKSQSCKCSKCFTCVVAVGARFWSLALTQAPHGALIVVDTFFIDRIYIVLWRPQWPKGLLTVLTTVGATRAWNDK